MCILRTRTTGKRRLQKHDAVTFSAKLKSHRVEISPKRYLYFK